MKIGGFLAAITTGLATFAGAAQAEDWAGFYGGVALSVPTGEARMEERSGPAAALPGDFEGVTPGLVLGFDQQSGNIVYGGVVSVDFGQFDAEGMTNPGVFFCPGNSCNVAVQSPITARARVGYAVGDFLPYATAGMATARATGTFAGGASLAGTTNLVGWSAGLGAEYEIGNNMSVFGEYLHTDLGRLELPAFCFVQCFADVEYGQVRVGLNARF